jgi:hypothetical protein
MDTFGLIEILEESQPYKNLGERKMYRVYLEVDLNMDIKG